MGLSYNDYKYINNTGSLPGLNELSRQESPLYTGVWDVLGAINAQNTTGDLKNPPTDIEELSRYIQQRGYRGAPVSVAPKNINITPNFRTPNLQVNVPRVKSPGSNSGVLNKLKDISGTILPAVPTALGFIGSVNDASKYDGSVEDMNNLAGRGEASVMGRKYQTQKSIGNQESSRISSQKTSTALNTAAQAAATGTAVAGLYGGIIGGIGGFVSGLFASDEAEKKARRLEKLQRLQAARTNEFNRYRTYSDVLRDMEYSA